MIIPEHHAIHIARQRRHEAEAAAARHRARRAHRQRHPIRHQIGLALINAGSRLAPSEAGRRHPRVQPAS